MTPTRDHEQKRFMRRFSLFPAPTSASLTISGSSSSSWMGAILSTKRRTRARSAGPMLHNDDAYGSRSAKRARTGEGSLGDQQAASRLIQTLDEAIDSRRHQCASQCAKGDPDRPPTKRDASLFNANDIALEAQYARAREQMMQREGAMAFDYRCRAQASELEKRVDRIIRRLRKLDVAEVYNKASPRTGHGGQLHPRFEGDHFLSNVDLINKTKLFKIVSRMPKGAHLHIHFNACLPPSVLLDVAKEMDRMFITSDLPLIDSGDYTNYAKCEIQFSILGPGKERPGDLFSPSYQPRQTMRFGEFLRQFSQHYTRVDATQWLVGKLIYEETEAHGPLQTATGAWEKFNGRTRMMKGLFNYETAYRRYIRECLKDFVEDGIQYAEIRPNFMRSNQLCTDDGTKTIDNEGIMALIIEEVTVFKRSHLGSRFHGLKIIYCTPRIFKPSDVDAALDECFKFKQAWPEWIAGFDLVGEEAKGNPIRAFVPELLAFKRRCQREGVDIPFLFHCGETLDMGTDTDGNLVDALLLGSKRIGHGFALPNHPYIMQQMKAHNVCVELCPISNEVLGLTPRVNGHAMYQLLANNVHCSVSSDNGTFFRSSLSHDFYQVMVGKADMSLYGWKQLILWSLEHACFSETERAQAMRDWEELWDKFLKDVNQGYGSVLGGNEMHL